MAIFKKIVNNKSINIKRRTTMKKIAIIVITAITDIMMLTGCSFKGDNNHAIVEITTTNGRAIVARSYNNSWGNVRPPQDEAIRNALSINLEEGEQANVRFYCQACGHDEEYTTKEAEARAFQCDCPYEGDEEGNLKEYFVMVISQAPEDEISEE